MNDIEYLAWLIAPIGFVVAIVMTPITAVAGKLMGWGRPRA